ncbi:N5,N10-methylene tetrahydromethanopterin reductase [Amycolatopsis antarctica]|uniref:N5,N10-methylene tetrahydromethanopterin reductase n=1 Tax=Amycolatopsis antarctica TaxID=1854586 RepID=A0A263CZ21_9PSEU|nr:LLM class flavin-dependent oxidoreductase [Amycolatopsis antarctica]OZM70556.1 N5,N10-methylene tetrahydromethanopterin reductase [Amycolatopsis antarctica]
MNVPRISVSLPTIGDLGVLDAGGGLAAAARHVEDLGLGDVSVADVIVGDSTPAREAVVVAATAAAVTERIGIEFGVLVLPVRSTVHLAAQIQTLQHVSGDRLALGVGTGGFPGTPFWQAAGAPRRGRGERTDTALAALPGLIAGEPTEIGGSTVTLAPAATVPPVLIGGTSDAALRRAARFGDGWMPSLLPAGELAARTRSLRELAAERRRRTPVVAYGTHLLPAGDGGRRDAFVHDLVRTHGMPRSVAERVPVTGGPSEIADRIAEYAEAGADRIGFALDGPDWFRQCEVLARAGQLLAG